jgi:hypothetical protein
MAKHIATMTQTMSYALRLSTVSFDTTESDLWAELVGDNPNFDAETPSNDPDEWLELLMDRPDYFEFFDYDVSEDETDVDFSVEPDAD